MAKPAGVWRRGDRGGDWYAWIDGRRAKVADAATPKAEATRALFRLKEAGPGARRAPEGLTARDVFNLYLEHAVRAVGRGELKALTVEGYERFLPLAAAAFGDDDAETLKPFRVTGWAESVPTWGPTTRHNALTAVKAAFRWARRAGYVQADPIGLIQKPTPLTRDRIPDAATVAAWREAWGDRAGRDLLTALIETGCRPGEVFGLTAADVDLAAGTWTVENKTRRRTRQPTRTVFLTPAMVELSRRLCAERPTGPLFRNARGRPWTRNAVACRFKRLRDRGLAEKGDVAYLLRHLWATDALQATGDVAAVAAMMGHTDPKMLLKVYGKLATRTDHLRGLAARVRPDAPPPDAPPAPRTDPVPEGGGRA